MGELMTIRKLIKSKQKMKRHAIYFPEELFSKVEKAAKREGMSFNAVMAQFAEWGLEENKSSY